MDDRRFQPCSREVPRPIVAAGAMVGLAAWLTFAFAGALSAMVEGLSHGVVWAALLVMFRPFVDGVLRPAVGARAELVSATAWLSLVPGVVLVTAIDAIAPPLVRAEEGAPLDLAGGPIAFVLLGAYFVAACAASVSVRRPHPFLDRLLRWLLGAACGVVLVALALGGWRALQHVAPSAYLDSLPEHSRVADGGLSSVSRTAATHIGEQDGYETRAAFEGTSLEAHRSCRLGRCLVALARAAPSPWPTPTRPSQWSGPTTLPFAGALSLRSDDRNGLWVLFSDDRAIAAYRHGSLELSEVTVSGIAGSLSPERDWLWAALAGLGLAAYELRRRGRDERLLRAIESGRDAVVGPGAWLSFEDGSGPERVVGGPPAPIGDHVVVLGGSPASAYRGGPEGRARWVRGSRASAAADVRDRLTARRTAALASLLLLAAPLLTAAFAGLVL